MSASGRSLKLLLLSLAAWISHHQQEVIDYLVEENRVLKDRLAGRRLPLADDQRRRLAIKGKWLGRHALNQVATIVTPDTIMRWYRQLISLRAWRNSGRHEWAGLRQPAACFGFVRRLT